MSWSNWAWTAKFALAIAGYARVDAIDQFRQDSETIIFVVKKLRIYRIQILIHIYL